MKTLVHHFYSDGLRLDSRTYLPDNHTKDRRLPLVIACSGFTGLHRIHPERFARWLTRHGYACFSFDYRGFGHSEGPRLRVLLEEQVRDIRGGVAAATSAPYVDPGSVYLLGWAMGAGLVVEAARELPGVAGLCALNGLYDGADFQSWHRGEDGMAKLRARVEAERRQRARTGVAERVDPFEIYPLDPVTEEYVDQSLRAVADYDTSACSFEMAESLLRWSVLPAAPRVRLPLFLAHGTANALHPPRQAEALAAAYGGPVRLHWLDGAGHTEWMSDEHPMFRELCERLYAWLEERRAAGSEPSDDATIAS